MGDEPTGAPGLIRVHLLIAGLVQGVGFRYATERQARRLGLNGWVRNTPDGRVEIVAEGPADRIGEFVAWSRRGPSASQVSEVERRDEPPERPPPGFHIRF